MFSPRVISPTFFIIYGITGDLAQHKILPGLYRLEQLNMLPENFLVIGTSRKNWTRNDSKQMIRESLQSHQIAIDEAALVNFTNRIHMLQFDLNQPSDYENMRQFLDTFEKEKGLCFDMVHYLALAPAHFANLIENLGKGNLNTACSAEAQAKILIEKPFGSDTKSAQVLQKVLRKHFNEEQIYLVDHYLAKEEVQNLLHFIHYNPIFYDHWNSRQIRRVEIMASESVGVGRRGEFYDNVGALRDMFQSHLLQIMALVALKQPESLDHLLIGQARLNLLKTIKPFTPEEAVRGQYKGYQEEVGNPHSITETFASVHAYIDDERWRDTQFVLTSGKRMAEKRTVLHIYFAAEASKVPIPNTMVFEFYPKQSVGLGVHVKEEGSSETKNVTLNYAFTESMQKLNDYQKVVLSALDGDRSVFPSTAESLANWQTVQPLLDSWQKNGEGLVEYEPGWR